MRGCERAKENAEQAVAEKRQELTDAQQLQKEHETALESGGDDQVKALEDAISRGLISASRGTAVPSRHRRDSCLSDEVVGGFFSDFEAVRTAPRDRDAPRRRGRDLGR